MAPRKSTQAGAQTSAINDVVAAWNSNDTEKAVSFYTDDIVYEDLAFGQINRGKEELRAFINGAFATVPNLNFELKSSFVSGNWFCAEWVWSGTQKGDVPGIPVTGKRFSIRGASVGEIKEGKIKRDSNYYSLMDFFQQIGVIPPSSPK